MSFILRSLLIIAVLLCATHLRAAEPSIVTGIRFVSNGENEGLEIDIDGSTTPSVLAMRKPYRLAIDLPETLSAAPTPDVSTSKMLKEARQGLAGRDRFRLLLTLRDAVNPKMEVERSGSRSRIRLLLTAGKDSDFRAPDLPPIKASPPPSLVGGTQDPFVVVIDPGHGGIDKGATGKGGAEEKSVNLAFGLALRDALAERSGITVVMTREEDVFIPLNERSAIARRAGANLFVSLHADSIRFPDLRGATVYTLSEKASDGLARDLAESENSADRFAGAEWDRDAPAIHDILVDLVRQETEGFSEHFALSLVADLKAGGIRLINNPKRSAGFRVLRAPDVPSILLEMGYLSNEDEERLLTSKEWQTKVADVLARSIQAFSLHRSVVDQRLPN